MILISAADVVPVPSYDPAPYALSGLTFHQLPSLAKYYLKDVVGSTSPLQVTQQRIREVRVALQHTFFRALQGNDEALVKAWRAMHKAWAEQPTTPEGMNRFEESREQFLNVLLPEREGHYHEFMAKFDALVWLELGGRVAAKERMGVEEQKRYRNEECGLRGALEWPRRALQDLDRHVAEILQSRARTAIKTYFDEQVFTPRPRDTEGSEYSVQGPRSAPAFSTRRHSFAAQSAETRTWRNPRLPRADPSKESDAGTPSTPRRGEKKARRQSNHRSRSSARPAVPPPQSQAGKKPDQNQRAQQGAGKKPESRRSHRRGASTS